MHKFYQIIRTNQQGPFDKTQISLTGIECRAWISNYTNPGYGLSLVGTLWNAGSYRQPLEQEGNPMT